jgi:hypothetical protein
MGKYRWKKYELESSSNYRQRKGDREGRGRNGLRQNTERQVCYCLRISAGKTKN